MRQKIFTYKNWNFKHNMINNNILHQMINNNILQQLININILQEMINYTILQQSSCWWRTILRCQFVWKLQAFAVYISRPQKTNYLFLTFRKRSKNTDPGQSSKISTKLYFTHSLIGRSLVGLLWLINFWLHLLNKSLNFHSF